MLESGIEGLPNSWSIKNKMFLIIAVKHGTCDPKEALPPIFFFMLHCKNFKNLLGTGLTRISDGGI